MEVLEKAKRRLRSVRTPTGAELDATERDLLWFRLIAEHGGRSEGLPTSFLLDYTADRWTCRAKGQQRLTNLYHEASVYGEAFLDREDDYSTPERSYEAIHKITRSAELALEDNRGFVLLDREKKGTSAHQFMLATCGASLEIGVYKHPDLEWTSEMQLMADAPSHAMRFPCEITYKGGYSRRGLIPDRLFQIKYLEERPSWRTFAVECDRGNEPWTRANLDETSYKAKYLRYKEVISRERFSYKKHLNKRSGMLVLNIMTSEGHKRHVMRMLLDEFGPCHWMLFKVVPGFGKKLHVPTPMYQLLNEPWERPGYPPIDITKAMDTAK
jgi:hypothetical protein